MRVWLIVALIASFAPLVSERAEGEFIDGVETFSGQVLDTSTWQTRYNSVVVQNNGLTIPSGEVVTANPLVPVGGGVSVDLVVSQIPGVSNNYPGAVAVYLTTASAGTATGAWDDSFAAELELDLWAGNSHPGTAAAYIDHPDSGSGQIMENVANSEGTLGSNLTFEIDRPTSQEYEFSVLDSSGDVTGSGMLSAASFPGALYIDLHTDGGTTATFDSVTITPEPSTFALLGTGGISLAAYAWRRRSLARRKPKRGESEQLQDGAVPILAFPTRWSDQACVRRRSA